MALDSQLPLQPGQNVSQSSDEGGRGSSLATRLLWTVFLLTVVGIAGYGVVTTVGKKPSVTASLPILGKAPSFSLVRHDGASVSQVDLQDRVWLANFVFTRCAGPCPELSLRMRSIQQALLTQGSSVLLVTFSLEPENDTPAVLRAYAERFGADPNRWWFLTGGNQSAMHRIVREGFLQTVIPASDDSPMTHSERFILVDRAGRIRALYHGNDPGEKPKILHDFETLLAEPQIP